MKTLVLFAHGKESGPWCSKIRHLATIVERLGMQVLSPNPTRTSARCLLASLLLLTAYAMRHPLGMDKTKWQAQSAEQRPRRAAAAGRTGRATPHRRA